MEGPRELRLTEVQELNGPVKLAGKPAEGCFAVLMRDAQNQVVAAVPEVFHRHAQANTVCTIAPEEGLVVLERPGDDAYARVACSLLWSQRRPPKEGEPSWKSTAGQNLVLAGALLPSNEAVAEMLHEQDPEAEYDGVLDAMPMEEAGGARERILELLKEDEEGSQKPGKVGSVAAIGIAGADGKEYLVLVRTLRIDQIRSQRP